MRRRTAGLVGLVAALAVASGRPAFGSEGYGLDVVRSDADILEADPGQVVSVGVRVVEHAGAPVDVDEFVSLPEGWRLVTPSQGFPLAAGASATRLVAFAVPRGAAPGSYSVRYGVVGRTDPGLRDEEEVRVVVHAVAGVGVEILEQPSHVVAGETSSTRVLVRNDGNAPARIGITVTAGDGLDVRAEPAVVDLGARESREVLLVATPDSATARYDRAAVRVVVESLGGDASRAGTVVWVPVYPRHAARPDVMREIPVTAEVRGIYGDGRVGAQGAVYGAGPLDGQDRFALDFEVRGPGSAAIGGFGRHDEAQATLTTPWGDLRVGDQVWSTSPLLSPGRYARGVGVEVRGAGVALAGHYGVSRFRADPVRETSLGLSVGEEGPLVGSVHLLHLEQERAGAYVSDTLASARLAWRPAADVEVAAEVGGDRAAQGDLSFAYRLDARARTASGFALEASKARGGEAFRGYHQDVDVTSLAVVAPLAPKWTAQASVLHRIDGLAPGPEDAAATRETVARAKVRVEATRGLSIAVGPELALSTDAIVADARMLAVGGRAQIGWSSEWHAAWVETAAAWYEVGLARADHVAVEATGNLLVHPLKRQSIGIYGSWGSGYEHGPLIGGGDAVGLSLDWEPVDDLVLDVRGERGLDERGYSQVDGRATWRSPGGVEIGARGRWRVTKRQEGASLAAEAWVAVPIGIPVGRRQDVGLIRGRLADPSDAGLADVLVRAGDEVAVTDRRGRFALAVAPGAHILTVDPAEIGLDRVSLTPLPLVVDVEGGRTVDLALDVAPAATISGAVVVPDGVDPLGGVRVVLSDGEHRHVRLTDAEGRFSFRGIAPGEWSVSVDAAALPAWHRAEALEALTLTPGEDRALEIVVRPVERTLRMEAPRAVALVVEPAVVLGSEQPAPTSPPRRAPDASREPVPTRTWTLAPAYDPAGILPECHESIGAVWVFEPWWTGDIRTDLPLVASSELAGALEDALWLEDFATCPTR